MELIGPYVTFEGTGLSAGSAPGGDVITLQREDAMQIFQKAVVQSTDIHAYRLGLYGDVVLGRNLKGIFGRITPGKHLFSSRKNGCAWNPKTGVTMQVDEFPTCAIEYNGEQCPDALLNTCFERIFAPGLGVTDFAGTPEGQALLAQVVRATYTGLGNSMFDLYNFANHPLINTMDLNGNYRANESEWQAYTDQMLSGECGGLITQLDALKAEGVQGYTNNIPVTASGALNATFIETFNALKETLSPELLAAIDNGVVYPDGTVRYPIILCTGALYDQYKSYIDSLSPANELAYRFMLEGADGTTTLMRNVLRYDSMPVIKWQANSNFDAIVGTKSHRMAIVMPGNFGVLHDVDSLDQWAGMGLVVQRSPLLKDKGKTFMLTMLRWGAGIADVNLAAMASTIVTPTA